MSIESETLDEMALVLGQLFMMRTVNRSFSDFARYNDADLTNGIYSVIASTGDSYRHVEGYRVSNGLIHLMVIGQIKLSENSLGEDVERAEFVMLDELRYLINNVSTNNLLSLIRLKDWRVSGQIEAPYGWIMVNLSVRMRR